MFDMASYQHIYQQELHQTNQTLKELLISNQSKAQQGSDDVALEHSNAAKSSLAQALQDALANSSAQESLDLSSPLSRSLSLGGQVSQITRLLALKHALHSLEQEFYQDDKLYAHTLEQNTIAVFGTMVSLVYKKDQGTLGDCIGALIAIDAQSYALSAAQKSYLSSLMPQDEHTCHPALGYFKLDPSSTLVVFCPLEAFARETLENSKNSDSDNKADLSKQIPTKGSIVAVYLKEPSDDALKSDEGSNVPLHLRFLDPKSSLVCSVKTDISEEAYFAAIISTLWHFNNAPQVIACEWHNDSVRSFNTSQIASIPSDIPNVALASLTLRFHQVTATLDLSAIVENFFKSTSKSYSAFSYFSALFKFLFRLKENQANVRFLDVLARLRDWKLSCHDLIENSLLKLYLKDDDFDYFHQADFSRILTNSDRSLISQSVAGQVHSFYDYQDKFESSDFTHSALETTQVSSGIVAHNSLKNLMALNYAPLEKGRIKMSQQHQIESFLALSEECEHNAINDFCSAKSVKDSSALDLISTFICAKSSTEIDNICLEYLGSEIVSTLEHEQFCYLKILSSTSRYQAQGACFLAYCLLQGFKVAPYLDLIVATAIIEVMNNRSSSAGLEHLGQNLDTANHCSIYDLVRNLLGQVIFRLPVNLIALESQLYCELTLPQAHLNDSLSLYDLSCNLAHAHPDNYQRLLANCENFSTIAQALRTEGYYVPDDERLNEIYELTQSLELNHAQLLYLYILSADPRFILKLGLEAFTSHLQIVQGSNDNSHIFAQILRALNKHLKNEELRASSSWYLEDGKLCYDEALNSKQGDGSKFNSAHNNERTCLPMRYESLGTCLFNTDFGLSFSNHFSDDNKGTKDPALKAFFGYASNFEFTNYLQISLQDQKKYFDQKYSSLADQAHKIASEKYQLSPLEQELCDELSKLISFKEPLFWDHRLVQGIMSRSISSDDSSSSQGDSSSKSAQKCLSKENYFKVATLAAVARYLSLAPSNFTYDSSLISDVLSCFTELAEEHNINDALGFSKLKVLTDDKLPWHYSSSDCATVVECLLRSDDDKNLSFSKNLTRVTHHLSNLSLSQSFVDAFLAHNNEIFAYSLLSNEHAHKLTQEFLEKLQIFAAQDQDPNSGYVHSEHKKEGNVIKDKLEADDMWSALKIVNNLLFHCSKRNSAECGIAILEPFTHKEELLSYIANRACDNGDVAELINGIIKGETKPSKAGRKSMRQKEQTQAYHLIKRLHECFMVHGFALSDECKLIYFNCLKDYSIIPFFKDPKVFLQCAQSITQEQFVQVLTDVALSAQQSDLKASVDDSNETIADRQIFDNTSYLKQGSHLIKGLLSFDVKTISAIVKLNKDVLLPFIKDCFTFELSDSFALTAADSSDSSVSSADSNADSKADSLAPADAKDNNNYALDALDLSKLLIVSDELSINKNEASEHADVQAHSSTDGEYNADAAAQELQAKVLSYLVRLTQTDEGSKARDDEGNKLIAKLKDLIFSDDKELASFRASVGSTVESKSDHEQEAEYELVINKLRLISLILAHDEGTLLNAFALSKDALSSFMSKQLLLLGSDAFEIVKSFGQRRSELVFNFLDPIKKAQILINLQDLSLMVKELLNTLIPSILSDPISCATLNVMGTLNELNNNEELVHVSLIKQDSEQSSEQSPDNFLSKSLTVSATELLDDESQLLANRSLLLVPDCYELNHSSKIVEVKELKYLILGEDQSKFNEAVDSFISSLGELAQQGKASEEPLVQLIAKALKSPNSTRLALLRLKIEFMLLMAFAQALVIKAKSDNSDDINAHANSVFDHQCFGSKLHVKALSFLLESKFKHLTKLFTALEDPASNTIAYNLYLAVAQFDLDIGKAANKPCLVRSLAKSFNLELAHCNINTLRAKLTYKLSNCMVLAPRLLWPALAQLLPLDFCLAHAQDSFYLDKSKLDKLAASEPVLAFLLERYCTESLSPSLSLLPPYLKALWQRSGALIHAEEIAVNYESSYAYKLDGYLHKLKLTADSYDEYQSLLSDNSELPKLNSHNSILIADADDLNKFDTSDPKLLLKNSLYLLGYSKDILADSLSTQVLTKSLDLAQLNKANDDLALRISQNDYTLLEGDDAVTLEDFIKHNCKQNKASSEDGKANNEQGNSEQYASSDAMSSHDVMADHKYPLLIERQSSNDLSTQLLQNLASAQSKDAASASDTQSMGSAGEGFEASDGFENSEHSYYVVKRLIKNTVLSELLFVYENQSHEIKLDLNIAKSAKSTESPNENNSSLNIDSTYAPLVTIVSSKVKEPHESERLDSVEDLKGLVGSDSYLLRDRYDTEHPIFYWASQLQLLKKIVIHYDSARAQSQDILSSLSAAPHKVLYLIAHSKDLVLVKHMCLAMGLALSVEVQALDTLLSLNEGSGAAYGHDNEQAKGQSDAKLSLSESILNARCLVVDTLAKEECAALLNGSLKKHGLSSLAPLPSVYGLGLNTLALKRKALKQAAQVSRTRGNEANSGNDSKRPSFMGLSEPSLIYYHGDEQSSALIEGIVSLISLNILGSNCLPACTKDSAHVDNTKVDTSDLTQGLARSIFFIDPEFTHAGVAKQLAIGNNASSLHGNLCSSGAAHIELELFKSAQERNELINTISQAFIISDALAAQVEQEKLSAKGTAQANAQANDEDFGSFIESSLNQQTLDQNQTPDHSQTHDPSHNQDEGYFDYDDYAAIVSYYEHADSEADDDGLQADDLAPQDADKSLYGLGDIIETNELSEGQDIIAKLKRGRGSSLEEAYGLSFNTNHFAAFNGETYIAAPKPKAKAIRDLEGSGNAHEVAIERAMQVISKLFIGGHKWRSYQQEALPAILSKQNDYIISIPTGGGKSVLFQGPALYRAHFSHKLSIVVSPLRALILDQILDLKTKGFNNVDYLSGDRSLEDNEECYSAIISGKLNLLYVTPERFRSRRFFNVIYERLERDRGAEYFVFDEAHCISQWGKDFRPDYIFAARMCALLQQNYDVSLLMCSATMTAQVIDDLKQFLNDPIFLGESSDNYNPIRSHIEISMIPCNNDLADRVFKVVDLIEEQKINFDKSRMLIFCPTRRTCEDLSAFLNQLLAKHDKLSKLAGHVGYYHAALDPLTRKSIYDRFKVGGIDDEEIVNIDLFSLIETPLTVEEVFADEIKADKDNVAESKNNQTSLYILCTTKAFGMGMDIPNIHYLLHFSPPMIFEDYLQEVGRAGRNIQMYQDAFPNGKRIPALCLCNREDFEYAAGRLNQSLISWNEVVDADHALRTYLTKFKSLESASKTAVMTPFDVINRSLDNILMPEISEIVDQELETRRRVIFNHLEELGRIKLQFQGMCPLQIQLDTRALSKVVANLSAVCRYDAENYFNEFRYIGQSGFNSLTHVINSADAKNLETTEYNINSVREVFALASHFERILQRQKMQFDHVENKLIEAKYATDNDSQATNATQESKANSSEDSNALYNELKLLDPLLVDQNSFEAQLQALTPTMGRMQLFDVMDYVTNHGSSINETINALLELMQIGVVNVYVPFKAVFSYYSTNELLFHFKHADNVRRQQEQQYNQSYDALGRNFIDSSESNLVYTLPCLAIAIKVARTVLDEAHQNYLNYLESLGDDMYLSQEREQMAHVTQELKDHYYGLDGNSIESMGERAQILERIRLNRKHTLELRRKHKDLYDSAEGKNPDGTKQSTKGSSSSSKDKNSLTFANKTAASVGAYMLTKKRCNELVRQNLRILKDVCPRVTTTVPDFDGTERQESNVYMPWYDADISDSRIRVQEYLSILQIRVYKIVTELVNYLPDVFISYNRAKYLEISDANNIMIEVSTQAHHLFLDVLLEDVLSFLQLVQAQSINTIDGAQSIENELMTSMSGDNAFAKTYDQAKQGQFASHAQGSSNGANDSLKNQWQSNWFGIILKLKYMHQSLKEIKSNYQLPNCQIGLEPNYYLIAQKLYGFEYFSFLLKFMHGLSFLNYTPLINYGIEVFTNKQALAPMDYAEEQESSFYTQRKEFEELQQFKRARLALMQTFCLEVRPSDYDRYIERFFNNEEYSDYIKQIGSFSDANSTIMQKLTAKALEIEELKLADNQEQWNIYSAPLQDNINVIAGPGSGKTHVLTMRVARFIYREHIAPDSIMVLAYNRAVVIELKSRLENLFAKLGMSRIGRRLSIYTFHGLAKRCLQDKLNKLDTQDWEQELLNKLKTEPQSFKNLFPRLEYIMIDEFQDITATRLRLIKYMSASYPKLRFFTIGDINQSIYGFDRVAKISAANSNNQGFTGYGAAYNQLAFITPEQYAQQISPQPYYRYLDQWLKPKTMYLSRNYRSYQKILDLAASFLISRDLLPIAAPLLQKFEPTHTYCKVFDNTRDKDHIWFKDLERIIDFAISQNERAQMFLAKAHDKASLNHAPHHASKGKHPGQKDDAQAQAHDNYIDAQIVEEQIIDNQSDREQMIEQMLNVGDVTKPIMGSQAAYGFVNKEANDPIAKAIKSVDAKESHKSKSANSSDISVTYEQGAAKVISKYTEFNNPYWSEEDFARLEELRAEHKRRKAHRRTNYLVAMEEAFSKGLPPPPAPETKPKNARPGRPVGSTKTRADDRQDAQDLKDLESLSAEELLVRSQRYAIKSVAIFFRTNNEVYRGLSKIKDLIAAKAKEGKKVRVRIQGSSSTELYRERELYEIAYFIRTSVKKLIILDKNSPEYFGTKVKNFAQSLMNEYEQWDAVLIDIGYCVVLSFLEQALDFDHVPTTDELYQYYLQTLGRDDSGQIYKLYDQYHRERLIKDDYLQLVLTTMHKVKGLEFDLVMVVPSLSPLPLSSHPQVHAPMPRFAPNQYSGSMTPYTRFERKNYRDINEAIYMARAIPLQADELADLAEERRLYYVAYTRARKYLYAYQAEREYALATNQRYIFAKEQSLGLSEKNPSLENYVLSFTAFHSNYHINNYIRNHVKHNDEVVLSLVPEQSSVQNGRYTKFRCNIMHKAQGSDTERIIGRLSGNNPLASAMLKQEIMRLDGLFICNIAAWTLDDTRRTDERKRLEAAQNHVQQPIAYESSWCENAKNTGFVYVIMLAGYGKPVN